jgi:hypothetical protein
MSLLHAWVVPSTAEDAVEQETNFVKQISNKMCSCLRAVVVGSADAEMSNDFDKEERSKCALSVHNCIYRSV